MRPPEGTISGTRSLLRQSRQTVRVVQSRAAVVRLLLARRQGRSRKLNSLRRSQVCGFKFAWSMPLRPATQRAKFRQLGACTKATTISEMLSLDLRQRGEARQERIAEWEKIAQESSSPSWDEQYQNFELLVRHEFLGEPRSAGELRFFPKLRPLIFFGDSESTDCDKF